VLAPLVSVPVRPGPESLELTFRIPDDEHWRRVRNDWGDPGYLLGVLRLGENGHKTLVCFNLSDAVIKDAGGRQIEAKPGLSRLYGYSSDCSVYGLTFRGTPGETIAVRLDDRDGKYLGLSLIVAAYWGDQTKDRLVSLDLDDTLFGR